MNMESYELIEDPSAPLCSGRDEGVGGGRVHCHCEELALGRRGNHVQLVSSFQTWMTALPMRHDT
jgi:hypothetical protein